MKFKYLVYTQVIIMAVILLSSCGSTKNIVYFQGIDTLKFNNNPHVLKIERGDNLYITITSINKEATEIFGTPQALGSANKETLNFQGFLVDKDGNINFPLIGEIKIAGLTTRQAIKLIQEKAAQYISDPVVNIRFLNYKVTVLGEVAKPGVYEFSDERVTILDALGRAGDLTIYGKRLNVLICRETDNGKEYARMDLTSADDIFNSPYFYLQQNDVVYVEPNNTKVISNSIYNQNLPLILSTITTIVTVVSLIISINK